MNRFRFRFGSVLRVRGAEENIKKGEFGSTIRKLKEEEDRYNEIVNDIEKQNEFIKDSGKGKISIRNLINNFNFSQFLERRKSDQNKVVKMRGKFLMKNV